MINSNLQLDGTQSDLDTLENAYLTFSLNQSLYGIETTVVEEVFFLPELTPIPQAPRDIVGVINLRGAIIPVMNLYLRFGYQAPEYKVTDSLIILNWQETRIGIVVNQIHEVRKITQAEISQKFAYGRDNNGEQHWVFQKGIAHQDNDIIVVLNPEHLIHSVEHRKETLPPEFLDANQLEELKWEDLEHENLKDLPVFCPNATPEERETFQDRAKHLRQDTQIHDSKGFKPLAAIRFGGEFFGITLNIVREFTDVGKITPIPCCPPHIIGNMNLRGEIVTLIDICGLLNLPLVERSEQSKAVIIQIQDLVVGVFVEEVIDVLLLNPAEITAIPTAIHSVNDEYLEGATTYRDKMLSLLDLEKIIMQGNLVVDEVS